MDCVVGIKSRNEVEKLAEGRKTWQTTVQDCVMFNSAGRFWIWMWTITEEVRMKREDAERTWAVVLGGN